MTRLTQIAEVSSIDNCFEASVLAEVERTVDVELNYHHNFEEFGMLLDEGIFGCNHAHFSSSVEPHNCRPNEASKVSKSEERSQASFHCSYFYHEPCYYS